MKNLFGLVSTLLETAKTRLKNPLIGSFVFSWIPLNWKIILFLLFSSKTIEEKIELIEKNYTNYWLLLIIPIMFSVFYVVVLPFISAAVEYILKGVIEFRKNLKFEQEIKDIQNMQILAAEEWQLEKIRGGGAEKVENLQIRVNKLEEQIEENFPRQEVEQSPLPVKTKTTKSKDRKTSSKIASDVQSLKTNKQNYNMPSMKEILIRDLPKTEREWLLVYALFVSNEGEETFTRDELLIKYDESNRKTESRIKNLTNNLNNIVKSGQIKYINDAEMLLTATGVEIAKEILKR